MMYQLCSECDHFVELQDDGSFFHLDDGEKEHDHDAKPGIEHTLEEWKILRPDLFQTYPDGKIGPNSIHHKVQNKT